MRLLGADGWNDPGLVQVGEAFVEGAIFVDGFFAASPSPLVRDFVAAFQARYHEPPDLLAAQAYDTLRLCVQALKSGARSRAQLRDALLQIRDFPGVSGHTTIDPQGDAIKELYVLTVQQGTLVQLSPPVLATD
ncbi:MAG: hypothetical protein KatS3mg131_1909 [Candidatus Tectimicrobiota bacterium]|nr:MAG: hypothetical protein KatS3mg131_1909 [Candidatus Tectomicrobia bacterium]